MASKAVAGGAFSLSAFLDLNMDKTLFLLCRQFKHLFPQCVDLCRYFQSWSES